MESFTNQKMAAREERQKNISDKFHTNFNDIIRIIEINIYQLNQESEVIKRFSLYRLSLDKNLNTKQIWLARDS